MPSAAKTRGPGSRSSPRSRANRRESVAHFRACNLEHKSDLGDGLVAPDADDEYLFYQTVLGIWPPGVDDPPADLVQRLSSYMSKAVHEAKRHSSWINPNRPYDDAVSAFVEATLDPQRGRPFLSALARLRQRVERLGYGTHSPRRWSR